MSKEYQIGINAALGSLKETYDAYGELAKKEADEGNLKAAAEYQAKGKAVWAARVRVERLRTRVKKNVQ